MFNLHVGLPRIFPELLQTVAKTKLIERRSEIRILQTSVYQKRLRGLVNLREKKESTDSDPNPSIEAFISRLARYKTVAMSQHALLGPPEDIVHRGKLLPKAEGRLLRLSNIFANYPITIHIAITSQRDYLSKRVESSVSEKAFALEDGVPSWTDLVVRLKTVVPGSQIVVWDVHKPRLTVLAFLGAMLNVVDGALLGKLRTLAESHPEVIEVPTAKYVIPSHLINQLDHQFETDLLMIARMPGVTLMRSEDIADEMRLSNI